MLTIEYISLERDVHKQIMKTMGIDGEEIEYTLHVIAKFFTYPKT